MDRELQERQKKAWGEIKERVHTLIRELEGNRENYVRELEEHKKTAEKLLQTQEDLRQANAEIGRFTRDLSDTAKQWDDKCDELERLWRVIIEGMLPFPSMAKPDPEMLQAIHKRDIAALEKVFGIRYEQ